MKLPSAPPDLQVRGTLFTTHHDRVSPACSWRFWYLQHSKKVWFRVPDPERVRQKRPVFTYQGSPILHVSEVGAARGRHVYAGRPPVVWGDSVGYGWARGPQDTNLFLELWTRWTWLHPEACGRPDWFRVDLFAPPAGPDANSGHSAHRG
ncbi:hypothetical protein [Synechococcus sp. CBW1006]|uniref:hypothetical protein n=1 Tax=Synechococcus sp. CBW1006 TaxID=1353138 RepID=UPI0018CE47BD|nr:hypothetical protein [Synechococcus sp. CBW1006]QPN66060.1 hypothetical protein H8F26_14690 [Synechococcus sp. CBW1006]